MKLLGKILTGVAVALIGIQFIRPPRNESAGPFPGDIHEVHAVPAPVSDVLKRHCYDCHSNNTSYPWYTNVQPVGLWMAWHVREGKEHVNFSEFAANKPKRAAHMMEETYEMVEAREMPLPSYTIIHRDAKLSDEQIKLVADWARDLEQKILGTVKE